MTRIRIVRAGPLASLQDRGRYGQLRLGISESGPMDSRSFERAGDWIGTCTGTGLEFAVGLSFIVAGGSLAVGFDGGDFQLRVNGNPRPWPARVLLQDGDQVQSTLGSWGNYGYLRFDRDPDVAPLLGSRATNTVAGLGGHLFTDGDELCFGAPLERRGGAHPRPTPPEEGPIHVVWGLHADAFGGAVREQFVSSEFAISSSMNRMGVRLVDRTGVFNNQRMLTLVSDATVAGDIQILGDGTPIVLMRDHQPTGGYPRIATIAAADLDRFAQLRPGTKVRFEPVTVEHAQALLR